jgi:hypothetical protein
VLQLARGECRRIASFNWTGGTEDAVAPANPRRVALYIVTPAGGSGWAINPAGSTAGTLFVINSPGNPVHFHVRDYPGMVQLAWVGGGTAGSPIEVWEYQILY